jgi:uncharacterized protein (TIGR02996 family)
MARAPKRKPPAKRTTPVVAALAAVRTQRFAEALSLLLDAWRTEPSEALAEAISLVSSRLKVPPLVRGKSKAALAAWTSRAKAATPQDLPVLLEVLADASSGDGLVRLKKLATWMPDPRIDAALVDLLERVPYRATSTQPFWNALFALAADITDVRQLRRLDGLTAEGVAVTMQTWLRGKLAALRETTADRLVEHPEPPEVTEILALLGPRKLSIGSQNLEALLGAIYDAPDDDAPRLVLADALLERGDPRGELIALQLRGDGASKKRERELLDTHGKQWLGELAPVVMGGYTFARGFLAECRIDNRHLDRVKRLAGHPAWSTVRSLTGSALIGLHPVMRGLRRLSFTSYEARNHEGLPDSWRDLLLDTERPIEALRYAGIQTDESWEDALENNESVRPGVQGRWVHVPEVQEVAALCSCRALPKLRELVIVAQPDRIAPSLFASALIQRLDTVGFVFDSRNRSPRRAALAELADALRDAPVRVLTFELGPDYHTTLLALTRGDHGYRTATMTVGPTIRSTWSQQLVDEAIGILDSLPKTLRELRITARRHTDPQQVARLRAAAEQMRLAVCEVVY